MSKEKKHLADDQMDLLCHRLIKELEIYFYIPKKLEETVAMVTFDFICDREESGVKLDPKIELNNRLNRPNLFLKSYFDYVTDYVDLKEHDPNPIGSFFKELFTF